MGEELESEAGLIEHDLLNERIAFWSGPPFCPTQVHAISRVLSPVTGQPYGLAAVCRVWRLARSGVYRHLSAAPPSAQRRGPLGAMADEALTTAIRGVLAASPFHGEAHG